MGRIRENGGDSRNVNPAIGLARDSLSGRARGVPTELQPGTEPCRLDLNQS
jgi:hypothetical protein